MPSQFTRGGAPVRRGQGNQTFATEPGGAVRRGQEYIYGQQGILPAVSATVPGIAPASGGGTANFLRADGTWAAPPAGASATSYAPLLKTAGYTETATSGDLYRDCDLAAGFTVVLPAVAGNTARFTYKKMQSAGQITIDGNASETIDGGLTAVLNNLGESISVYPNAAGTGWDIS